MSSDIHYPPLAGRKRVRLSHGDYKIALICVLDVELVALRAMLDEIHEDLPTERGQNTYIFGSLSQHNVVVVVLPTTGNNHSGIVAGRIREDFPCIQYGLMVGVGGGIPGAGKDIRLGDVVVAEASSTSPAVIQFDKGKHHSANGFATTGHLNKPPEPLVATVKKLKAQHYQEGSRMLNLTNDMFRRYPTMQSTYAYPGPDEDRLFESNYEHEGGTTCEHCLGDRMLNRDVRHDSRPHVHYGTIGTSNAVLRNANERDRLAQKYQITCVETEAAGVVDQIPCLVIRGICDYADSHKNKRWQPYAAVMAAAYAKELLQTIPATELGRLDSSYSRFSQSSQLVDRSTYHSPHRLTSESDHSKMDVLLKSLLFQQMDARLRNILPALSQTCNWLKSHQKFRDWHDVSQIDIHHGFLWIKGKPGCGKSTLMRTLFTWERAKKSVQDTIYYFFNARASGLLEKSSLGLYRSLTHQLLTTCHNVQSVFLEQFSLKVSGESVEDWCADELKTFLIEIVSCYLSRPLVVLIDALDEGDVTDVRQLVNFLDDIASAACSSDQLLRICLSSRHYPEISIRHSVPLIVEDEQGHEKDIKQYIYQKLTSDRSTAMDELRDHVWEKSAGIFLWVVLVIPILNKAHDQGHKVNATTMSDCLRDMPAELDSLFETILRKSSEDICDCVATLQWVLYSKESLTLTQLYIAVAIKSTSPKYKNSDTSLGRIQRCLNDTSRGLIEITKSEPPLVQFIHETVRRFLEEGGLTRVDPALSGNIEGISHEFLRQCCDSYLRQCTASPELSLDQQRHKEQSDELQAYYPLLKYVTTYLFEHAEKAEFFGRSQRNWLESLNNAEGVLTRWICFQNVFELAMIRRYTLAAPLIYILGAQGLSNLLRLALSLNYRDITSKERYKTALRAACAGRHEEAGELLINAGFSEDVKSGEFGSALYTALNVKSETLTDLLVQNGYGKPVHELEQYLSKCVSQRNLWGIQKLVQLGCSVDCVRSSDKMTPLIQACTYEDLKFREIIHFLICAGADVNAKGGEHGNALQTACVKGHSEVVSRLLEAGADVNASGVHYGSALQAACYRGNEAIVRLLLETGAEVNASGGLYGSALQAACYRGNEATVRILLEAGAEVNASGGVYGSALQAAPFCGSEAIVRLLLETGAEVNASGGHYGSALQAACGHGKEAIVRLLLETGAEVNASGGYYGNALQAACGHGNEAIVRLLLETGAEVNASGGLYGSTLQAACGHGNEAIVRLLLETGAEVNASGGHYGSALQAACAEGKEAVMRLLLEIGAEVNASGGYYGNALQAACYRGSEASVQLLLEAGADVNASGGYYGSALNAAAKRRHRTIVKLLKDARARSAV